MTISRVEDLLKTLDLHLNEHVRYPLDRQDVIYCYEFDTQTGFAGTLRAYRPLSADQPGSLTVNVDTDWFYHRRVWFRKTLANTGQADKYEAFIEYLYDYRDPVIVHPSHPLVEIELHRPRKEVPVLTQLFSQKPVADQFSLV